MRETEEMNGGEAVLDIRSAADAVEAAEDDESGSAAPLHEIESLCMRCGENGITRLLLTRIPHFREIVLMAFECPHCNERNNEIQFAGQLQDKGCCYHFEVPQGSHEALNRQVVKSDSATIKVPELDFEIPPESQCGTLSTVEGILLRAVDQLQSLQEERKKADPNLAEAIDGFLVKLKSLASADLSFTFVLDDPSGNSFIENPFAPSMDPLISVRFYDRTMEQQSALGFLVDPSIFSEASISKNGFTSNGTSEVPHGSVGAVAGRRAIAQGSGGEVAEVLCRYSAPEEVDTLPSTCGACGAGCVTRFYSTKIPYFREVVIMASTCDMCGYRSSELKAGGEISKKGKRITLHVEDIEDLSRDVIKADSASVEIPELELELESGTLSGIITTVEGLITKIKENLEKVHRFNLGDSVDDSRREKWQNFKAKLSKLLELEEQWTLVIDDGLASSFISPTTDSMEGDTQLTVEEYERSWEQNEELGLNDMDTSSADYAYTLTQ